MPTPSPRWRTWRGSLSRKRPREVPTVLTSLQNPRVRAARKLLHKSARYDARLFLIEGIRCVREALASGLEIDDVFVSMEMIGGALPAEISDVRVTEVSESVLRSMSDAVTPQGVVAVGRMPAGALEELGRLDLVVVLAGLRDPGNAGTLVRSAVAAGADAVVFAADSVDPYSPKVVRSSAGTLFRIPVVRGGEAVAWGEALKRRGLTLVGMDARARESLYEADLSLPLAVVIGNEAWGLPEDIAGVLDRIVSIPMPGPAESLNAGIAGSVLLFDMVRRRRLESAPDG